MDKQQLELLIIQGKTLKEISELVNKSIGAVRGWLAKYGIKAIHKPGPRSYNGTGPRRLNCSKCNRSYEYDRNSGKGHTTTLCNSCLVSKRRTSGKEIALRYKGSKCTVCGYCKSPSSLEFHHEDPNFKEFTISRMLGRVSESKLKLELDKCILLCSNCHLEHHSKAEKIKIVNNPVVFDESRPDEPQDLVCTVCGRSYKYVKNSSKKHCKDKCNSCRVNTRRFELKDRCIDYKGGACAKCGYSNCTRALSFHHRDPNTKHFQIGGAHSRGWAVIRHELDKCDMLCENCHRETHANTPRARNIDKSGLVKVSARRARKQKFCLDCNKKVSGTSFRCRKCSNIRLSKRQRKIEWPPRYQLEDLVKTIGFLATGRLLGVSDNAIRNHMHRNDKGVHCGKT